MYPLPVATWAGCYLGGTIGAATHRTSGQNDTEGGALAEPFSSSKSGGIYGGYLGCNWQNRAFVYGIEGDFSGVSGSGSSQPGVNDTDYGFATKLQWLATIRGRAGLAVDNAMVYMTGGAAFANVKASAFSGGGFFQDEVTDTRVGWTVGAGVEYMFTPNWIGRLEFLYADFGNQTHTFQNTGYSSNLSHELMIGRVGLAYKW
jgi:outer membrane immunogenic protein